jgi:hypothetical protein
MGSTPLFRYLGCLPKDIIFQRLPLQSVMNEEALSDPVLNPGLISYSYCGTVLYGTAVCMVAPKLKRTLRLTPVYFCVLNNKSV